MKIKTIGAAAVSLFIILMTVLFFIFPKTEFSENENRYLAQFPRLSAESFFKGDFMIDVSEYLRDQFPFRSLFMAGKTAYEKNILAKEEINGVYIADDDFYIEKYQEPKNTEKIIDVLNSFDESVDIRINLMLVPTASTIYESKLPKFVHSSQANTMNEIYEKTNMNDINILDVFLSLKENDNLFYRLDHHWTTFGAYNAYKVLCEKIGLNAQGENEFNIKKVADDFKGSVFSKVSDSKAKADSIYIYEQDNNISVDYKDKGVLTDSLYNMDYLSQKDKYSMFLDNINSLIVVTNENAESDDEIAVIKDSYANCFVPFLVNHYKKIHIFDTRYYKEAVSDYISGSGIDEVLILYNMNTLDTDTGITRIY